MTARKKPLAPLFEHTLYFREKISDALFGRNTADHVAMAGVGIDSLVDVIEKYRNGLEARGFLKEQEESQLLLDIDDAKYAINELKTMLADHSSFHAQAGRLLVYAIDRLVDRMEGLAKDIDKNG
jgi:putative protein kinase ArgK-like GTPase of G3E family